MKINENGMTQYHRVTPIDRVRYQIKARWIRFTANCYGLYWMMRYKR